MCRDQSRTRESGGGHRKVKLPTFKGKGTKSGVNIDDSAALLDLMESERDSARRAAIMPPE